VKKIKIAKKRIVFFQGLSELTFFDLRIRSLKKGNMKKKRMNAERRKRLIPIFYKGF
jgi:hypothetical protein